MRQIFLRQYNGCKHLIVFYYNRRHNRSAHLFQGRYKSIVVGEESYWQSLSFYIHLNPIRAGIDKELDEYKYSSYHDYVKMKKIHHWVVGEEILRGFGNNKKSRRLNTAN
jgi:hypothetical protein